MRQLLVRWAILALSVFAAVAIVPGITLDGRGRFLTVIGMALVLGIINTIVKPILKLFSLPLIALTLGLFLLVINTVLFALASWLVPHFKTDGFLAAFGGALVVSVVGWVISFIVPDNDD